MDEPNNRAEAVPGQDQATSMEERYRTIVAARMKEDYKAKSRSVGKDYLGVLIGLASVSFVLIFVHMLSRGATAVSPPPVAASSRRSVDTRYIPGNQKIASGQVVIRAGEVLLYRINVEADMYQAR